MNRKWKKVKASPKTKESPPMFEDEDMGTSESSGEVRITVPPATPEAKIITAHSTPIQNIIKSKNAHSPEINYHESPIEPLTQNPPNEVGWDYQRPVVKEEQSNSFDITKTPKRTAHLSKKRNSNSPLLYKPLKKKLIQEEKQHVNSFITDLQAIAINTKKIKEKPVEEINLGSQLVVELDSQPSQDSDLNLQVTTNTDESPVTTKTDLKNNNFKALLDDSVEDDAMIICSQKVEEKENASKQFHQNKHCVEQLNKKVAPTKTTSNLVVKTEFKPKEIDDSINEDLLALCSQKVEEKVLGIKKTEPPKSSIYKESSIEVTLEKPFKKPKIEDDTKIFVKNSYEKNVSNESKDSCSSKAESNSLEIPDDSFDELFGELDEEIVKIEKTECVNSVNKSTKSSSNHSSKIVSSTTKTTITKFSNQVSQIKTNVTKNSYNCVNSRASKPTIQNKLLNTKANFGYLNQDYMQSNASSSLQASTESRGNEVRTFKTKSFSDSNFEQSFSVNKYNKSESNLNSMRQNQQIASNASNQNSNLNNSSGSEESGSWRRTNSTSSLSLFTPAEIERKRQEALMKRQANLKKRSQNATFNRYAQNSVKR